MTKLRISASVGEGGVNRAADVDAVARQLQAIGKLEGDGRSMMSRAPIRGLGAYTHVTNPITFAPQPRMSMAGAPAAAKSPFADSFDWSIDAIIVSIKSFQRAFVARPDGLISPNGRTLKFLRDWSLKPVKKGVELPGRLQEAWDLVNPFLPAGTVCTSGYRSAQEQRDLLQRFFKQDRKQAVIATYGQAAYDAAATNLLANENTIWAMVNGSGQAISKPGSSKHQTGRAIDLGGKEDDEQVKVIRMIAKAHPTLLSGFVLKEANKCVHFELR